MDEIEARLAVLEERVFGISYPRAKEVVAKLTERVRSTTSDEAIEILGMGDPEYTRAQELIREVRRYVGKAQGKTHQP